jgi:hypothetical protein
MSMITVKVRIMSVSFTGSVPFLANVLSVVR